MSDTNNTQASQLQRQNLDKFIDTLIDEKNFKDLTPEIREEIKKDIRDRLDRFMLARIISQLSDEQVIKYEEMLREKRSEEEIQNFITSAIPDFVDFLTNVMLEFRGVYLGQLVPPIVFDQGQTAGLPGMPPAPVKPQSPPIPVSPGESAESTDLPPAPPVYVKNTVN